jgi:DNA-binding MarR family transcriptional regulator
MSEIISKSTDVEKARIMLGLLESVQRGDAHSQRRLASELGIALGLVNAYLKRCVTKGLVKVGEAPARRYVYYLTPVGFAEKSRLTVEYLSYSFSLFRRAKTDCSALLRAAHASGVRRMILLGGSDLAEIAVICALDCGIEIAAVVDAKSEAQMFAGVPVQREVDDVGGLIEAVLVTDMSDTAATIEAAVERFGAELVLVPAVIDVRVPKTNGLSA